MLCKNSQWAQRQPWCLGSLSLSRERWRFPCSLASFLHTPLPLSTLLIYKETASFSPCVRGALVPGGSLGLRMSAERPARSKSPQNHIPVSGHPRSHSEQRLHSPGCKFKYAVSQLSSLVSGLMLLIHVLCFATFFFNLSFTVISPTIFPPTIQHGNPFIYLFILFYFGLFVLKCLSLLVKSGSVIPCEMGRVL